MYEASTEEIESAYEVRFRSRQEFVHPREFSAREKLERDSRYSRRRTAPSLRDGAPRRSNNRFGV